MATEDLLVRATIHLPGLRPGEFARVNPRDPHVAELLASEFLVPVESVARPAADGVLRDAQANAGNPLPGDPLPLNVAAGAAGGA